MRRTLVAVIAVVCALTVVPVVLMAIGGLGVRRHYREPWSEEYNRRFADPRLRLVAVALLAPSGHNEQPWRVALDRADPMRFDLYVDTHRLAPAVDPFARQTLVSQGTFLEYLRIAGERLGYPVSVELFPQGRFDESHLVSSMRATPVARVTLGRAAPRRVWAYAQMFRSDTNRSAFAERPLSAAQAAGLRRAVATTPRLGAASTPALDVRTSERDKWALAALAERGVDVESRYHDAYAESAALTRANERAKNAARYGFSVEGQGTSGVAMYALQGALTAHPGIDGEAASGRRMRDATRRALAHTPAFALLTTATNARAEQVQAGVAYARLALAAREAGLVVQPLSQVLQEYPAMEELYRESHARFAKPGHTIQMLVRVGAPTREYSPSMRLDARDLVH